MKIAAFIALSITAGSPISGPLLTFDEAAALATRKINGSSAAPYRSEIAALRRGRLPSVRAEVSANTSRTLDLFAEGPYQSRYATSVLAFDYPLWDGGATSARIDAIEGRLLRLQQRNGLDDARFAQLVEAFGQLYIAQRETELIRPVFQDLSTNADRSDELLAAGEISNLTAIDRGDALLSLDSQLLDAEARRIDAATKLRLLTGVDTEPVAVLDLGEQASHGEALNDDQVHAATNAVELSRARLREVRAASGFRALLSGFAGIGAAEAAIRDVRSEGSFGIYGLRIHLSYPLLGGLQGVALAEARADLQQSLTSRDAALQTARARASEYRLREEAAGRRIALLRRSVEAAKERERSLLRLAEAGVRSPSDLAHARAERTRREVALLVAEVERWKAARLLSWMTAPAEPGQP